jgi:hypothetical protein
MKPSRIRRPVKGSALESAKGSTVMITQSRSARVRAVTRDSEIVFNRLDCSDLAGRLIQMALAFYLIPALLIVLVVGGMGMLVLTVSRLFTGPIQGSVG